MSTVIEETVKTEHNHGKNFGRYVVDCPRCQELHPNGPPVKAKKEKPAEVPAEVPIAAQAIADVAKSNGLTEEALMRIMIEANKALGAELRKPDPEVMAEKEAQKVRDRIAKEHEMQVVEEARRVTRARQEWCASLGHRQNQNNATQSAISGQICSDGMFHWICVTCLAEGVRKPTRDEMS